MTKGKLKIFFGYSAGVGKTYAMLKAAQELKSEGVDVVIGYLEHHARPETEAMAEGLEILPLKVINYKGIELKEFDVDQALKRKPTVILVDELAHTNAPGSKNTKRYLDVEELVNNGIDVWTTVNVQHIESLHDIVDNATTVDVSERVPDEIFDYADEVVLIDIEPEDLIERMREGKIYNGSRAKVALDNFFSNDNLSSLRELFLRRGADRLEKKSNNGELKTKILVLISPSPSSEKNIRVAARMSEAYHCKFSAMYVETNGELSDTAAQNLKKHIKLVRDLGGDMVVKYGDDVIDTVADYVKLASVTNLILGKTWQSIGKKVGLEDKFIMRLHDVEIIIVPDNQRFVYKENPIKKIVSKLFYSTTIIKKYKTANRTLDILNLVSAAACEKEKEKAIAEVLAKAFCRSCIIFDGIKVVACYGDENTDFFGDENEVVVAEWCKVNKKCGGKGTDTLRGAKGIYFPIQTKKETVVIGFSCVNSKMSITDRMVFSQIETILKAVL